MKSEIREASEPEFPRLMRYNAEDADFVALMTAEEVGIIVHVAKKSLKNEFVGYQSIAWDMSKFEDFNGELVLKNT